MQRIFFPSIMACHKSCSVCLVQLLISYLFCNEQPGVDKLEFINPPAHILAFAGCKYNHVESASAAIATGIDSN